MTIDAIEELRRQAPIAETTSEVGRARQRSKLEDAIAAESISSRQGPLASGGAAFSIRTVHTLRQHAYLVGAAAAMVAAAGVAVPLSLATNAPAATRPTTKGGPGIKNTAPIVNRTAPVMKLAAYRLRLPATYRLATPKTTACHVPAGFPSGVAFVGPSTGPAGSSSASRVQSPSEASQVAAAASADGGCVWMMLAPPYTPTATNPDPEAGSFEANQPVQVGSYEGRAGTWTAVLKPSGTTSQQASLYVEIPLAGDQTQDLVLSSYGLSMSELISLVAKGLSVAGTASN